MPKPADHRSRYEIEALERHAAVEAASAARRRERGAPKRDDFARAGYYVLLLLVRQAERQAENARKRGDDAEAQARSAWAAAREQVLALTDRAGFPWEVSAPILDEHLDSVRADAERWVGMRRIAREQAAAASAARSAAEQE